MVPTVETSHAIEPQEDKGLVMGPYGLGSQGRSKTVTARFYTRGGVSYSYLHPNSYRQAYRFLEPWQRAWGNYERKHLSDPEGFPIDFKEPPMASLEDLLAQGWDVADLRDPLEFADLTPLQDRLTRAKEQKFERLIGNLVESSSRDPPASEEQVPQSSHAHQN
jgi:hypothetical protein